MKKFLPAIALGLLINTGCYSVKVTNTQVDSAPAVTQSALVHTLIGGLVSLNSVDAGNLCGSAGVYSVESKMGIIGLLASAITGGFYVPMTAEVTCAQK